MSFREFLNYKYQTGFNGFTLTEILNNHVKLSLDINTKIKPIKTFEEYIKIGYYPFFAEDETTYHKRLAQIINTVLESDISSTFSIDANATFHLKKLLAEIVEMVPFKPNVKKLSEKIGISRDSLIKYLKLLERADVISLLFSQAKGISALNKPEKIYLNNPNISFALNTQVNKGNLRESFFINQLIVKHKVRYSGVADFLVDDKYTFEIGGKSKTYKQIAKVEDSWIVIDNVEGSSGNKIPLWLFGFLY